MPAIRLAELHPIFVHFPIALLIVSVACDLGALLLRRAGLLAAATWCLVLGVPGAGVALFSGWVSEHDIGEALGGRILELHKVSAVLTTLLFGALLLARLVWLLPRILAWAEGMLSPVVPALAGSGARLRTAVPMLYAPPLRGLVAAYLALSVAGLILLGLTGYLGGSLVYDHGIGVPTPTPLAP